MCIGTPLEVALKYPTLSENNFEFIVKMSVQVTPVLKDMQRLFIVGFTSTGETGSVKFTAF
jgi:hypothetical protein